MTSGIEAVGDVATGAAIAGAMEPSHGARGGESHAGPCLNCGTALVGGYCHACGQNSHLHRTIGGFLHDLLHGVFHFEGKIWETLPLLLFKPGELTRRFIAGERAKFVSPMALFLFCTFLMFAIVGSLAGEMHAPNVDPKFVGAPRAEIEKDLAKEQVKRAQLRAQIKAIDKADGDTTALEKQLETVENDMDAMKYARGLLSGDKGDGTQGNVNLLSGAKIDTGWHTLDQGAEAAKKNPDLFLYRLQSSAYKYSWLLIPISTPLVWLLFFWKRQYKFYDHLVFVTFSLTFMMLFVTVLTLGGAFGLPAKWIGIAGIIIPPLHTYRQLRGAYLSSRLGALMRTWLLQFFGLFVLILYLAILLGMGMMH